MFRGVNFQKRLDKKGMDFMKSRYVDISEYGVFLTIEIISGYTGEVIDYHSEDEFYQSYEKAQEVAKKYRKQIGEQICSWGDDIGILKEVYVDEEPRINQYCIEE